MGKKETEAIQASSAKNTRQATADSTLCHSKLNRKENERNKYAREK